MLDDGKRKVEARMNKRLIVITICIVGLLMTAMQWKQKTEHAVNGEVNGATRQTANMWKPYKTADKRTISATSNERHSVPAQASAAQKTTYAAPNRFNLSEQDLNLMANAVYGEARGEPYIGQVAVAAVILNRVESPSFPNTVSGVIFQPGAFTAVADGQIWLTPNETAKQAVRDALNGYDPTDGCIYYFNPETATSKWIWSRPQVKKIGKHIFCK